MDISRRGLLSATAALGLAGPAAAAGGNFSFPFRVTRNRPWTAVFVDKAKTPLVFLVDTGASEFGISNKAALAAGMTPIEPKGHLQAFVGRRKVAIYHAREVVIANAMREVDVYLAAVISDTADTVDGIIPAPDSGVIAFDFVAQTITLSGRHVPDVDGWVRLPYASTGASDTSGSLDRLGERSRDEATRGRLDLRPAVDVELDGRSVRLLVDTGASDSIYLSPDFVKANGLWDRYPAAIESKVHTLAETVDVRVARADSMKLGQVRFERPIITLADPKLANADGHFQYGGLIGMELLRRFNIVADPFGRRMWLKPNTAIHDVYRYDRAGLDIDTVDGVLRVTWLAEGAPAARAGLKLGDRVSGWAGLDGYHGLLWALQGAAGTTVRIQVDRDGGPQLIAVKLEELV